MLNRNNFFFWELIKECFTISDNEVDGIRVNVCHVVIRLTFVHGQTNVIFRFVCVPYDKCKIYVLFSLHKIF